MTCALTRPFHLSLSHVCLRIFTFCSQIFVKQKESFQKSLPIKRQIWLHSPPLPSIRPRTKHKKQNSLFVCLFICFFWIQNVSLNGSVSGNKNASHIFTEHFSMWEQHFEIELSGFGNSWRLSRSLSKSLRGFREINKPPSDEGKLILLTGRFLQKRCKLPTVINKPTETGCQHVLKMMGDAEMKVKSGDFPLGYHYQCLWFFSVCLSVIRGWKIVSAVQGIHHHHRLSQNQSTGINLSK